VKRGGIAFLSLVFMLIFTISYKQMSNKAFGLSVS